MTHVLSWRRGLAIPFIALVLVGATPRDAAAQGAPVQQSARLARVRSDSLAARFGLTLPTNAIDVLGLGDCVTGTLDDPLRLEQYGLRGMHAGARVTIMRSAPDKLQVEADELEPVLKRTSSVVRLDGVGLPVRKPGG